MVNPKVSIIIPLWIDVPRFYHDLAKFSELKYSNYEIIIVSDWKPKGVIPNGINARIVRTGKKSTGPAEKRDIAIKKAKGTLCAFIDDDAYPDPNWLKNAVRHFCHPQIAAVGGPGITPIEDSFLEQITGLVYSSFFCGGFARHRFVPAKKSFDVVDYPAFNLLVRKNVLKNVGGYGTYFYGGEDTFLCLKIVKSGRRIVYDPKVVVYHHRRPLFSPYLKQIANVGKHRGYFAKRYPETSAFFWYFVPAILALGFIGLGLLSMLNPLALKVFLVCNLLFLTTSFLSVIQSSSVIKAIIASFGIIMTHIVYGLSFINGLFTKEMAR